METPLVPLKKHFKEVKDSKSQWYNASFLPATVNKEIRFASLYINQNIICLYTYSMGFVSLNLNLLPSNTICAAIDILPNIFFWTGTQYP